MAKYCIIGKKGFLGSALASRFKNVTSVPTKDCDVIFDFGSPVHPPFEENPDYYFKTLISRHLYFLSFGVYYVWPSSALVYETQDIAFIHFKRAMEEISRAYKNNLGLRIFPVYGPGENRTVISQWCRLMREGKSPVIYGNGEQARDFIYIDDAIDQITSLVENKRTGIYDIGRGIPIKFNDIYREISAVLKRDIKPIYESAPKDYSQGIVCQKPLPSRVLLSNGIKRILEHTI